MSINYIGADVDCMMTEIAIEKNGKITARDWRERIKCMFGVSAVHDKKFEFLLEALAPTA